MDTATLLATFFGIVVLCIGIDWHCRGLADRRLRRSLHAEVESYLRDKSGYSV